MTCSPLEDWTLEFGTSFARVLIKRDDLLPFPLGGNKYRKLTYELRTVNPSRHQIVTVGSASSNHCRTIALMAARLEIPTHLVLHRDANPSSAIALLRDVGAHFTIVEPNQIAEEVELIRLSIIDKGKDPYVIPGGCHTVAGVAAYADAVEELAKQIGKAPDVIVVASGTGATQAGIIAGCVRQGWQTTVKGISVAREYDRGRGAVIEALSWICHDHEEEIEFVDTYRAGGYGKTNSRIEMALRAGWSRGLPLDRTYTGKAFAALQDLVECTKEPTTIVFWHTGGLMQYLTS